MFLWAAAGLTEHGETVQGNETGDSVNKIDTKQKSQSRILGTYPPTRPLELILNLPIPNPNPGPNRGEGMCSIWHKTIGMWRQAPGSLAWRRWRSSFLSQLIGQSRHNFNLSLPSSKNYILPTFSNR